MPEPLAGKRLLIVEEALKDYVGHWYEYVKAVVDLNRAAGVEVTVVAHAAASPALRAELGARPVFARTLWEGDYRRGPLRKLGLVRHNWLVFRKMRQVLREAGGFDCLFAPTVVGYHIWGWRMLLWFERRRIGRMVLLIRNNVGSYAPDSVEPRFGAAARLLRLAIRSLAPDIAARRAAFATDSARLADEYRALSGMTPTVFPSPRVAPPLPPRQPRKPGDAIVFSCLGPARFEKGIDLLQQAIALYLGEPGNPPARFVIQWNLPVADAAGAPFEPAPALIARREVRFLREPLASIAYDRLLGETDCMVLPYRRDSYFARISGVAVEAVTAGIPVITTADTWPGELVKQSGAGIVVADGDIAGLADAMATMARDGADFRRNAAERRGEALAEHSGEEFLNKLWGLADGA